MFMACGVGALRLESPRNDPRLFQALMFLGAGSVIHGMPS